MKIAIDISPIVYGTGVSVYTRKLVENLTLQDTKNEYVLFGGSLRRKAELNEFLTSLDSKNITPKIFMLPPALADFMWNRLHVMPVETLTGNVDIYHSSDWSQAPSKAFKITTVHDLVPILYPQWSYPKLVKTHKRRLSRVMEEVDIIIVPTLTTKNDLLKLGFMEKKIRVVPEGVDARFGKVKKDQASMHLGKYGIKGKYLLAVGVNERKNTQRIIDAYKGLKSGNELKLVIIGYPYKELESPEGVIFTNHIDDKDLPYFYAASEALVYPSLYEGFGLPILEAFSSGIPVVTSNLGSTSEVAGDSAVLVDPQNTKDIREGIEKAMKDREKLVKSGLKQAQKYTWEECARKTLEIYSEFKV